MNDTAPTTPSEATEKAPRNFNGPLEPEDALKRIRRLAVERDERAKAYADRWYARRAGALHARVPEAQRPVLLALAGALSLEIPPPVAGEPDPANGAAEPPSEPEAAADTQPASAPIVDGGMFEQDDAATRETEPPPAAPQELIDVVTEDMADIAPGLLAAVPPVPPGGIVEVPERLKPARPARSAAPGNRAKR